MNRLALLRLFAASMTLIVTSCSLEPYIITSEEEYTRNFIKKFGLIDQQQDWNLAKESQAQINLGAKKAKSVKVYGKKGERFYLIAELNNVSGNISVPVDVPKDCVEMMVNVDGQKSYGRLDSPLDLTGMSRGVPGVTYGHDSAGDTYSPDPPVKTYDDTKNGYNVTISHTNATSAAKNNFTINNLHPEYQYFNTRQISPIVAKTPWTQYKSLNTGKLSIPNTDGNIGLLPESGVYNREMSDLQSWLIEKKGQGYSMVEDFRISPGSDGMFTIFPFYYGTNLQHEMGVYLLDENFNPLLASGGSAVGDNYTLDQFIYYPIFKTRDHGDLQIQPHYDSKIKEIKLDHPDKENDSWIKFEVGKTYELEQYVKIRREKDGGGGDEWMTYAEYLTRYGATTHSRVVYHAWVDEAFSSSDPEPVEYATCTREGSLTTKKVTKGHAENRTNENLGATYLCVSIPTEVKNGDSGKGQIFGVKHDVTISIIPATKTHTWSANYTGLPTGMTYSDYWREEGSSEPPLFEGSQTIGWNNDLSFSPITDAAAGDVIKITFSSTSGNQVKVAVISPWYVIKEQWLGETTTIEIELSATDASNLRNTTDGWCIQGAGTVSKVELIRPSGFNTGAATTALVNHYRQSGNAVGGACSDGDGYTLSSADTSVDLTVNITNNTEAGFAYTVTLSKTVTESSSARRRTPKAKPTMSRCSEDSRAAMPQSRATEFDMSALLEETGTWTDVNSYFTRYLRLGEEVSSYPVDMDMLGRTRGYDVTILVKNDDGQYVPYTGYLGVYLKIVGSNALKSDEGSGWDEYIGGDSYVEYTGADSYVVFSQRRFNRQEQGTSLYPQISAISTIHPSSGDTFLSFEDMRVTHAGPSEGGSEYKYWEKSSDRDVNDVIFKIYGVDDISNDDSSLKPKEVDDEGFPWILAVEDLGATDDFDFNDLVVKVSSVTKTLEYPADEEAGTDAYTEYLSKKVVFTPLAAGGTLPLYLRWNGYTLSPGTYYLGDTAPSGVSGASPMSGLYGGAPGVGTEIHRWFGAYPSSRIINTTAPGPAAKPCVMYVPIVKETGDISPYSFTISGFGAAKKSVDGNKDNIGISVYVMDERTDQLGNITPGWTVSRPEDGKVSQMFIIYDTDKKWRWPHERNPINAAYPKFEDWIGDSPSNYDWFENYNGSGGVIDRTD